MAINGSQNSGKCFSYVYQFIIKNIVKDTNEQADEEIYRARSGRVLSTGFSVQVEFGVFYPPTMWIHSPTWNLSEPHSWDFYGNFITVGVINSISSPSPLPRG